MLSHMQAKGLSAGYNGEAVFRGLDLKIPEGSITTLIGSNGSGKSTILKTLCRIISPDSGAVYLDGEAIHRMPTKRVAQRLALLPQGAQAPAGITVGDLVEYGRFPYRSALSGLGEKDREIIQWALASTGMSSLEHREMERLSGGQQQRAWIAMALAQKTGLLFLDEPTTYLDISHQLDILYLLRRLNRENGVTIVMVLHDLNHAIMFSDYLVAIKDGILHSAGTPQEVITQQALREIFDIEAEVITHPVLNVPVCLPFRITEQNKKQEVRTHEKGLQSVVFSVLVGALLLCAGCGKSGDIYTAGVYTASAEGYSGSVTVAVEFDGSSILSVHVLSHSETVNISDLAIDELPSRIVEAQTWDVDAVSSATFTSDAIREAVRDCLAQAALR